MYIRLEDKTDTYSRHVYKMSDLLYEVGGMSRSLWFFGFIASTLFTDNLFFAALLEFIYFTRSSSSTT